jgi:hypothetical protein
MLQHQVWIGMDRLIMYLTMLLSEVLLFPRPEKTSSKLEDDENGLFLFAANENQMEFDY